MENYYFGILFILIVLIFLAFFIFMRRGRNISEYFTQNENENPGNFGEGANAIVLREGGSAAGGGGGLKGGSSYFVGKVDSNNGKYIKSSGGGGESYHHSSVKNANYSIGENLSQGYVSLSYNDPNKKTPLSQPLSTQSPSSPPQSSTTINGEQASFNINLDYSPKIIEKDC